MRNAPTNSLIEHLRLTVLPPDGAGVGDGELLGRFVERHDEAAFAALVHRHGPMVWGVCRRLLNRHDAEDAFQATFLVLARKAASIRSRQAAGNWLYGVAHQTALHARRAAARRRAKEVQVTTMPDAGAAGPDPWADLQPLLDEELSRLPDVYRTVVVLCDLEGRTRKEVARRLGVPEGTVAGRIARGRALLARRLTRRGVALSGGALAAVLTRQGASAGVPNSVVASTIKAVSLVAAGKWATGAVSVQVAALTEGVMKAMLFNKLKAATAVVLILGLVTTGATLLTDRTAAGQDDRKPVAEKPVGPAVKPEKEGFTAWGKEVGGLQAGLGFRPGEHRAYHLGETVKLALRVRNVGKEAVKFQYLRQFFIESPPAVTDGEGKPVRLPAVTAFGIHLPVEVNLAPGKEVELYELELELRPASESGNSRFWTLNGTGKFSVQYVRILGASSSGSIKLDPALSELATGKLELEIKAVPPKQEKEPDKEAFTVWGKEVGGLQAGLGYPPGEHRAYHLGEEATVVLRVRNVGKEAVEFKHIWAFFVENPPTITDAEGKPVRMPGLAAEGLQQPHTTTIAPGKEVKLYEWNIHLLPKGATSKNLRRIQGAGKFSLQCERVVGPTSGNSNHPDPTLDKLATGKLELEVTTDPPPAAGKKSPAEQELGKEGFTAWGREVGGLQAGLGFRPGERRAYHHGETVTLVVRLRNVAKKEVKFSYLHPFYEHTPTVTDAAGKPVPQLGVNKEIGERTPGEVTLAPGKELELHELKRELRPASESGDKKFSALYGTGKISVQYEQVLGLPSVGAPGWQLDPDLDKLATGKLELEVGFDPPPAAENKDPQKQEKEAFTAWGKKVGRLQAGLGFRPGEKRAYHHGEAVTVVLRVRNPGDESDGIPQAVEFKHIWAFFVENPPTVTDAEGKPVRLPGFTALGLHGPSTTTVAPGKEVELYEWTFDLRSKGEGGSVTAIHGTGKFSLQCERIVGPTSANPNHPNPTLDKLATGKLELEVKEAPPEKQQILTPEEAIKVAGDSRLAREFNAKQPPVEFKVEFVTKAILVKAVPKEGGSEWEKGHGPGDVGLRAKTPADRKQARFLAILTANAISQLNKAGIKDIEKHFRGRTIRVRGAISWCAYDGLGTPPEVEVVVDDLSHLEVID